MNLSISSLRIPRLALSLSLILWVGGAGCLIGCENMAMAAMDEVKGNATVIAAQSCAKPADHSCCAKHRGSSTQHRLAGHANPTIDLKASKLPTQSLKSVLLSTSGGTMHTCPLAMNAGALATKARTDEGSTMTAPSLSARPLIDSGLLVAHSPPPAWFSNRGHTYLRCCVFLI